MSTFLRAAMEEVAEATNPADEATVLIKGPLSQVFANALDIAYAKPNMPGTTALESQAQEVTLMRQALAGAATGGFSPYANTVYYSVSKDDATNDDLVNLSKELCDDNSQNSNFILVIDATGPSSNGEQFSNPTEQFVDLTMESLVKSFGGKVLRMHLPRK